jgi:hypothetical protein
MIVRQRRGSMRAATPDRLGFVAVGLLIVAIAAAALWLDVPVRGESTSASGRQPQAIWQAQSGKASSQNAAGLFGVKAILVTPKEMLLFYAAQGGNALVGSAGFSSPGGASPTLEPLGPGSIQPLGQVGGFDVGVVHVPWADRPGQELTLQLTPSASPGSEWRVVPLKQASGDPARHSVEFLPLRDEPSQVRAELGALNRGGATTMLKLSALSAGQAAPSVMVRVDQGSVVSPVSETEFNAAVAPVSPVAGSARPSTIATPAPTEPPRR